MRVFRLLLSLTLLAGCGSDANVAVPESQTLVRSSEIAYDQVTPVNVSTAPDGTVSLVTAPGRWNADYHRHYGLRTVFRDLEVTGPGARSLAGHQLVALQLRGFRTTAWLRPAGSTARALTAKVTEQDLGEFLNTVRFSTSQFFGEVQNIGRTNGSGLTAYNTTVLDYQVDYGPPVHPVTSGAQQLEQTGDVRLAVPPGFGQVIQLVQSASLPPLGQSLEVEVFPDLSPVPSPNAQIETNNSPALGPQRFRIIGAMDPQTVVSRPNADAVGFTGVLFTPLGQ